LLKRLNASCTSAAVHGFIFEDFGLDVAGLDAAGLADFFAAGLAGALAFAAIFGTEGTLDFLTPDFTVREGRMILAMFRIY
jgi:hypothetical protein